MCIDYYYQAKSYLKRSEEISLILNPKQVEQPQSLDSRLETSSPQCFVYKPSIFESSGKTTVQTHAIPVRSTSAADTSQATANYNFGGANSLICYQGSVGSSTMESSISSEYQFNNNVKAELCNSFSN